MRLTAWEEERLLIFSAAELARRHRDRGLALNAPEAIALICDAMLDAARAGAPYDEVEAAGRAAVSGFILRAVVMAGDRGERRQCRASKRPAGSSGPLPVR